MWWGYIISEPASSQYSEWTQQVVGNTMFNACLRSVRSGVNGREIVISIPLITLVEAGQEMPEDIGDDVGKRPRQVSRVK